MQRMLPILVLAMLLSACIAAGGPMAPYSTMPSSYRYHSQAFHIKVYWNYLGPDQKMVSDLSSFLGTGQTMTAQGYVENYSSSEIYNIQLLFMAYDAAGNYLGAVVGHPQDYLIQSQQNTPFLVHIPLTGKEARLEFNEKYDWRDARRDRH